MPEPSSILKKGSYQQAHTVWYSTYGHRVKEHEPVGSRSTGCGRGSSEYSPATDTCFSGYTLRLHPRPLRRCCRTWSACSRAHQKHLWVQGPLPTGVVCSVGNRKICLRKSGWKGNIFLRRWMRSRSLLHRFPWEKERGGEGRGRAEGRGSTHQAPVTVTSTVVCKVVYTYVCVGFYHR